ncbi:MAG: DNA mismatch repair endonuclease MutL [Lentisphaerae bacterium]|nr:DNA mismatch repair endonuclease MutL [Victivallaceae bacterium]NLK83262.1 DNA mismatch repair endonuclease MutL [Lentisphaerota bacterium]
MSKIRILSEQVSNRIAAGEVIERPASVVKELVENAIDAGATRISVAIEKAGVKLISVTDNGYGMDADDALLCLEPHATGKIREESDIDNIITLGFRGEAIPSIASVSRFTLRTRHADSPDGTEVVVNGGKAVKAEPTGCAPGTEIMVRDLFFNTPARKKFMRSAATEEKHIQEVVYQLALPYPEIYFELTIDGNRIFSSPGAPTLESRITTFFGRNFMNSLLPVAYSSEGITVNGFTALHGFTRSSRREQRTFVNGRAVEAPALYRGIREGYGGMVEIGRFPPAIIFMRVDPHDVDVNVHPAKREVRFRHEYKLSGIIAEAIKTALRQAPAPTVSIDPAISLRALLDASEIVYEQNDAEQPALDFTPPPADTGFNHFERQIRNIAPIAVSSVNHEFADQPLSRDFEENQEPMLPGSGRIRLLGFLDCSYLVAIADNGLLVVDQHAAHERVLFERLLKNAGKVPVQKLLLPITLELSRAETAFVEKNLDAFSKIGFDIAPLSSNTIMLNGVPASLKQENIGGVLRDTLSELLENNSAASGSVDEIALAACKAAVKAHDLLTMDEARGLLNQMAKCDLPFSCPHGRPTIINISKAELEKRFGRR